MKKNDSTSPFFPGSSTLSRSRCRLQRARYRHERCELRRTEYLAPSWPGEPLVPALVLFSLGSCSHQSRARVLRGHAREEKLSFLLSMAPAFFSRPSFNDIPAAASCLLLPERREVSGSPSHRPRPALKTLKRKKTKTHSSLSGICLFFSVAACRTKKESLLFLPLSLLYIAPPFRFHSQHHVVCHGRREELGTKSCHSISNCFYFSSSLRSKGADACFTQIASLASPVAPLSPAPRTRQR